MRISAKRRINIKMAIKNKAEQVILARFPDWKQRNMLAAAQQLGSGDALTSEEASARETFSAAWSWINAVRARSDELEAQVDLGCAVDMETGWPSN